MENENGMDLWEYSKQFIKPHLREKILAEMDLLELEEKKLAEALKDQHQL